MIPGFIALTSVSVLCEVCENVCAMRGNGDNHRDRDTLTRIGPGDFTATGPNPYARSFYLHAVARCVPEAIHRLRDVPHDDEPALRAWGQRWGFTDDWALRSARSMVAVWREHPEANDFIVSASNWEPVFPPGPSWDPLIEREASFRARVDAYIASIKRAPGIRPTPEKRTAEHFEWLALHHAGGWKYARIAERYDDGDYQPAIDAISHAVTGTAELIGLTLRATRGRTRGRKLNRRRATPVQ
jgi:hypothetical protein